MSNTEDREEPRFWRTVREDIHRGDFRRTLRQDFDELKEFYLDKSQKKRLENMGRIKRWFFTIIWLLKILILRLSSTRRILLLIGIVLLVISDKNDNQGLFIIGGFILLFILMLELKDKLLAHHEISQGRLIQQALMPERSPHVPGWELWLFTRPANEIGGDLVDFVKIDQKRFGVSLADVSGKGLGAALLMAKLQATIHALVPDAKLLDQLAVKINEIFYSETLPSSFASLIYLELESHSGQVRLINAGHPPVIKLGENEFEELPKGSRAIGLAANSTYDEQNVKLKKGDLLLIYSDGLTEARNIQGDFFGEKRLFSLLSRFSQPMAKEIGERLLIEVDQFIGDAKRYDDLSFIVLKFVG